MPRLTYPDDQTDFQRFSKPVGTNSRNQASGVALQHVTNISPDASDGNTVQDHLVDIKARMSHFTDTEVFKGEYSNSTTYSVGDEVAWTDPDTSQKAFFKRLVAGDDGSSGTPISADNQANWSEINADIHNLAVKSATVAANSAVAFRAPTGDVFFNRSIVTMLLDAQTESEVAAQISAEIAKVVTNSRWKGTWQRGTYAVGDYVEAHGGDTYRCIVARDNTEANGPGADTTGWVQITGTELLVVQRVRDMLGLLVERLGLTPAVANRGMWVSRSANGEGYAYDAPPMQWKGAWVSGSTYYFGDVVTDDNRLHILSAASTVTTPKTGTTRPGSDSDWTHISLGHTSDVSGWRGTFSFSSSYSVGDMVRHRTEYYISRTDHAPQSDAPDRDPTNWYLLDTWMGTYSTSEYYPQGGVVVYDGGLFWANAYTSPSDPDPGEEGDTKWLRMDDGDVKARLAQLRTDLEGQIAASRSTHGFSVATLDHPPTNDSEGRVWLSGKDSRGWTGPAALINGNTDYSTNIGDEAGAYELTSGVEDRVRLIIGRHEESDGDPWYGAFTRKRAGATWEADVGELLHNPFGSGVLGVGSQRTSPSQWKNWLLIKQNVLLLLGGGTELSNLWVAVYTTDDTLVGTMNVSTRGRVVTFGDVNYRYLTGTSTSRGPFGDRYEVDAESISSRTVDIAFRTSASGDDRYFGGNELAWTHRPDASATDANVVSNEVHTMRVVTRTEFTRLTGADELVPRTLYLTYGS